MPELVAIDLAGSPAFVAALRSVWDAGNAAAALDRRLPAAARAEQLEALAPTAIIDSDGYRSLTGGVPVEPGDALVVATSGTTARPKAAVLTRAGLAAASGATATALQVDPDRDKWLACLPLAHVGGLSVVVRAILTDTPLEVHDGFDAAEVMAAAESGATLVSLVPTALQRIDPFAFRHILLGGSAIPADRPANSTATYGMTETGGGIVYNGRPLADVKMRINDGEVQLSGPMLMRTYRDGSDPRTADGWYPTGDSGEIVAGVLRVFGRLDDAVITGGEKVWPDSIEATLETDPAVAEAAIVGRPDPEWGQAVTAVIVLADGADAPTLDQLRDRVKAQHPTWCAPRSVEVRPSLPRTALGKLQRHLV